MNTLDANFLNNRIKPKKLLCESRHNDLNQLLRTNRTLVSFASYWKGPNKLNKFGLIDTNKIMDANGKPFPTPYTEPPWSGKNFFLIKLKQLEKKLLKKYDIHTVIDLSHNNCQLCNEKNISHFSFILDNVIWSESLVHYIQYHNIKPSSDFIKFVLDHDPITKIYLKGSLHNFTQVNSSMLRQESEKNEIPTIQHGCMYIKIHSNQLLVIDALMEHGGITKKYKEKHEKSFRYSEHAGVLDIDFNGIKYIIVSGKTSRASEFDKTIFLPQMNDFSKELRYIFHTHPPTPRIGGRVESGILYEYPSASDIIHFVGHVNNSNLHGSLVLAPEGLYNIRKFDFTIKKLSIPQKFIQNYRKYTSRSQDSSILKHGDDFNDEFFMSHIAQDTSGIDNINEFLKKHNLWIDFFPRQKNTIGQWIIGTIYLPVCMDE